jgi:hypothetical protein
MIQSYDPQVAPLIEVFELYMLRDAALSDMREPTVVAARAMLDAGMSPEIILTVLDGAVRVAATETAASSSAAFVRELSDQIGPWLLGECFNPLSAHGATSPAN